jgi:cytochrome b6-f complex iron-sulfur subunit
MDRRMFVVQSACAFATLASAGCASLAAVRVTPEDGRVRLSPSAHPSLAQPGGWLKVQPEAWSTPLYVLALENGEYAALSPICTHRGCTVNISGPRLVCPCHGSTYDREGNVVRGPAERALQRFPTHVLSSGEVVVEIGTA